MVARPRPQPRPTAGPAPSRRKRSRLPLLGASYTAGARLLRALPPGARHAAAAPGGSLWFWANRVQRAAALDNYAAVLGLPPDDPRVTRVARRAFQNYGRVLIDFVLMGSLSAAELVERVEFSGLEHVDAALELGRGAILATGHIGSWDMGGSAAGALGYRIATIAERFAGSLDDAVVANRQAFGLRVIPAGRAAVKAVMDELAANAVVPLLCDLEHGPGVEVEFFGRRAIVPGGPAAFALKSGAPVMTASQHQLASGRHAVEIDEPVEVRPGDTKESLTQRVITRLEEHIRLRPDQWFAFRRVFRDRS